MAISVQSKLESFPDMRYMRLRFFQVVHAAEIFPRSEPILSLARFSEKPHKISLV